MEEILKFLDIHSHNDINDGIEAILTDSNDFGRIYTKLEKEYEIDEDISTFDNIIFKYDDKYDINLIANYEEDSYKIRIVKTKMEEDWWLK